MQLVVFCHNLIINCNEKCTYFKIHAQIFYINDRNCIIALLLPRVVTLIVAMCISDNVSNNITMSL